MLSAPWRQVSRIVDFIHHRRFNLFAWSWFHSSSLNSLFALYCFYRQNGWSDCSVVKKNILRLGSIHQMMYPARPERDRISVCRLHRGTKSKESSISFIIVNFNISLFAHVVLNQRRHLRLRWSRLHSSSLTSFVIAWSFFHSSSLTSLFAYIIWMN